MILGIGIDIIEIERVRKLAEKQSFIQRILTPKEQECLPLQHEQRRMEHIAGRFAAKEAASKALGTGIGKEVSFQDIEILSERNGRPHLHIRQEVLQRLFPDSREIAVHLSISHSHHYAVAQVVVEQANPC